MSTLVSFSRLSQHANIVLSRPATGSTCRDFSDPVPSPYSHTGLIQTASTMYESYLDIYLCVYVFVVVVLLLNSTDRSHF